MALALQLLPRPSLPRPTESELDALRSALVFGSRAGAAGALEITDHAMAKRLATLYHRIKVVDRAQAVAWMDDHYPGWRRRMPE